MQTYVMLPLTQNYVFLHDIVESFSSMINVAFVIFLNSPTASSIVPWQIFKLRFIGGDARSTPSQKCKTPVSVTDNGNPGTVGIPPWKNVLHAQIAMRKVHP